MTKSGGPYVHLINPVNGRIVEMQCSAAARFLGHEPPYTWHTGEDVYEDWLNEVRSNVADIADSLGKPVAEVPEALDELIPGGRCHGTTKAGTRCTKKSRAGSTFCGVHS